MYDRLIDFIRAWYETDGTIPLHEPIFGEKEREYVLDTLDSTFVSSVGEYVSRFEKVLARYLGGGFVVATVNGTTALQLALQLAGTRGGDEVITQPLTFVATANAIAHNHAVPSFVDVQEETLGLCPEALERYLDRIGVRSGKGCQNRETGRRIAAILPMHTFGHPCRMEAILDIAEHWGVPVVEDAAEALGSKRGSGYCGGFGKLGVFSFNGNKTITCGGGGAIITGDEALAARARHLSTTAKKDHPWKFAHDEVGYNYRMPNLNAALACAQMESLDAFLLDKRRLAKAYNAFFKETGLGVFVDEPDGARSNFWLNAVITENRAQRDALLKETNGAGVMTRPAWELMTDLEMFKDCPKGDLTVARRICQRIVNLPSSARKHG
ncbi:MAG: LegC family aminotransferase [Desulfobacter sp.]|nr:MAG: LegC family aminotransferase [Desulfobacter sp.]